MAGSLLRKNILNVSAVVPDRSERSGLDRINRAVVGIRIDQIRFFDATDNNVRIAAGSVPLCAQEVTFLRQESLLQIPEQAGRFGANGLKYLGRDSRPRQQISPKTVLK